MRITQEMMVAASMRRLSTRLESYEQRQAQLGAGRRMLVPSDDPGGASRALGLRASLRTREQEQRNAEDAKSWLGTSDSQLQAAVDRLQRVRDLAVRGATELSSQERKTLAVEVKAVREELVSIGNFRFGGRPLFSGFADVNPIKWDGAQWVYAGDNGQSQRRVGEQDVVTVNVTGGDVFGFDAQAADASGNTKNVFTMLDDLVTQLETDDVAGIRGSLDKIDGARTRLTDGLGRIGSTVNWIDSAVQRSQTTMQAIRGELAEVEDVDIAEAVMELKTQEIAYQATLQALARALPQSLVSFLR